MDGKGEKVPEKVRLWKGGAQLPGAPVEAPCLSVHSHWGVFVFVFSSLN